MRMRAHENNALINWFSRYIAVVDDPIGDSPRVGWTGSYYHSSARSSQISHVSFSLLLSAGQTFLYKEMKGGVNGCAYVTHNNE